MGTKGKEYFIYFDFDCDVTIVKELQKTFLSDIKRKEYSLDVNIVLNDDVTYGMSLYPDHFKKGSFSLTHEGGDSFRLQCHGTAPKSLDPSFDKDLVAQLSASDLLVLPVALSNSDAEAVDLDPDDPSLHGRCSLQ